MIRSPRAILALLTALNLVNYMDRLVLSAVLPKLQEELGISNFVGGLLATVFLVGYFATSPIFGSLGDRKARKPLLAIGVIIWSFATIASGMVHGAAHLLVARALVGVGEASYATIAPTLIDEISPQEKKGRWLAVFYVAAPIGSALGYLVGGFAEKHAGWRSAFYVAGIPGILLALLCLLIAEPPRAAAKKAVDWAASIRALLAESLYVKGILGYSAYTFAVGAFSYWAPKFLYARYGLPLAKANFTFGLVTVVAGAIGTAIGGSLGDRGGSSAALPAASDHAQEKVSEELQHRKDAPMVSRLLKVCGISVTIAGILAAFAFLSPSPNLFFVLAFFCEIALFVSTSPINAVILRSVPFPLRASAMALSIFAIHALGDLWSPPLVGLLQDHLPVALAMMSLPVALVVSGAIWLPRKAQSV